MLSAPRRGASLRANIMKSVLQNITIKKEKMADLQATFILVVVGVRST